MWCPADGPDDPGLLRDCALDAEVLLEHWARLEAAAFKRASGTTRPRPGLLRQRGESVTLLRVLLAQLDDLSGLPSVLTLLDALGPKAANFFEKYGVPVTLAAMARLALKSHSMAAQGTDLYGADLVEVLGTFMQEDVEPAVVTKVEVEVLAGIGGRTALPSVPDWAGAVGARLLALACAAGGRGGLPRPAAASRLGAAAQMPRPGSAGSSSGSTGSAGYTDSAPSTLGPMDMATTHWRSVYAGSPDPWFLHQHMLAGVHSWAQLLTEKVAATTALPPKALALGACSLGLIAAGLVPSEELRPEAVPDELWEESLLFKVGQTANQLIAGSQAENFEAPPEISGGLLAAAACCTQDELRRCAFQATSALQVAMEEGFGS